MGDQKDERGKRQDGQDRRGRLAEALRSNLLKRKAQGRARKKAGTPPKEGGQDRA